MQLRWNRIKRCGGLLHMLLCMLVCWVASSLLNEKLQVCHLIDFFVAYMYIRENYPMRQNLVCRMGSKDGSNFSSHNNDSVASHHFSS